jgi:hypothetical protein
VTTIARTLVDLTDIYSAELLANVIHEAAYRKRFTLPATYDAIARANGRHNLHVLHDALAMHAAGSAGLRSRLEGTFNELLQLAGITEPPLINTKLHGFEVDFHWPARKLAIEVDGPGHDRPRAQRTDALEDRYSEPPATRCCASPRTTSSSAPARCCGHSGASVKRGSPLVAGFSHQKFRRVWQGDVV